MGRNRGSDSMSYRACGAKIGLCVKGNGGVRMCENDCRKREQRRLKTLPPFSATFSQEQRLMRLDLNILDNSSVDVRKVVSKEQTVGSNLPGFESTGWLRLV